jgi:hypothetical protein
MNTNKEESMNNEKTKDTKGGGKKLRIRKPQSARIFMKLVWKIHEVARGKGAL